MSKSVFVSLFFEAEPFAAIVIAHSTHGHSHEFVLGAEIRSWRPSAERGSWGGVVSLPTRCGVCGRVVSSPSRVWGGALALNAFWTHWEPRKHV